jgi:hypothetical protein
VKTLHVAPGLSAAKSLRDAVKLGNRDDEVIGFPDDLSCGPIAEDDPAARQAWWPQVSHDGFDLPGRLRAFWERVAEPASRLVVWYGAGSALEVAFLLAWAERMEGRAYAFVEAPVSASVLAPERLQDLFGQERTPPPPQRETWRRRWAALRAENAPFRILADDGLVSAPIDHFDPVLLRHAATEWRKIAYLVGHALSDESDRYFQVGDLMLFARVAALVEQGRLEADGDPWDLRACRVRRKA